MSLGFITPSTLPPYIRDLLRSYDDDPNLKVWGDRSDFLKKLFLLGAGWDGFEAAAPSKSSVDKTLAVMKSLPSSIPQPPQLMVDEDGSITLTWGKAREGILIFLTMEESYVDLLVMDDDESIFSKHDIPYESDDQIPVSAIDIIKKYLEKINL